MRFADPAIETGVEPRAMSAQQHSTLLPSYTSETGMAFQIPSISPNDLSIFDDEYNTEKCAGYLSKKASKQSNFSKGKWQKRWFFIDTDIRNDDNYFLEYSYSPDDSNPSKRFPLRNASIKISSGNSFVITIADDVGSTLTLSADSSELMERWVSTIESVILVANRRDKALSDFHGDDHGDLFVQNIPRNGELRRNGNYHRRIQTTYRPERSSNNPKTVFYRPPAPRNPTLRFDIDVSGMPPGTSERSQFVELFIKDLSKVLLIQPSTIEVIQVKPVAGMGWLTSIEFDLHITLPGDEKTGDEQEEDFNEDPEEALEVEREGVRQQLLTKIAKMMRNPSSPLFKGFVTCKLDRSFALNLEPTSAPGSANYLPPQLPENDEDDNDNDNEHSSIMDNRNIPVAPVEVVSFSPDSEVLRLMQKYKDVQLEPSFVDMSHFTIFLYFEERRRPISILNPHIFRKRCCGLWPFEVKQALGITGTLQDLWMDPVALIPKDLPKQFSDPIRFEPSVRMNGQVYINASHLRADHSYEVEFEDRREDILNDITDEEMECIKDTFQQYDIDGDGGISKPEMMQLIRDRSTYRMEIISQKFNAFKASELEEMNQIKTEADAQLSRGLIKQQQYQRTISVASEAMAANLQAAELARAQHVQQLREAQNKLLALFEAADVNGDGIVSYKEFFLAEVWWLRCVMNPEKTHMFG